jgi:hypothetical protein
MRQYLEVMQTPDGERQVRQQLTLLRHTAAQDRHFQQALREIAHQHPPEVVGKLMGLLERCRTDNIPEEELPEYLRVEHRRHGGGGGGGPGGGVGVPRSRGDAEQQRGELGTRRTEPVVVAGQRSLVTPSMERPLARRVTVRMAAKELLSDTVAYFNHLLTSALLRSSNTLKRKNGKRLAKLGRGEETGNVEFRE